MPNSFGISEIYGGAQGIWVDRESTSSVSPNIASVTVSILHTGEHYPDDLSDDGVIYHYPETRRSAGRDRSEVDATKAAHDLGFPIFVILNHPAKAELRLVRLGWVADWDQRLQAVLDLVRREDRRSESRRSWQTFRFSFTRRKNDGQLVQVRVGQQKFRFEVLKQYGAKCRLCSIAVPQLLAAAHICGKEHDGSDDWRNGIPLCHTHHAAFDAQMFAVHPDTLEIEFADGRPAKSWASLSRSCCLCTAGLIALLWNGDLTLAQTSGFLKRSFIPDGICFGSSIHRGTKTSLLAYCIYFATYENERQKSTNEHI